MLQAATARFAVAALSACLAMASVSFGQGGPSAASADRSIWTPPVDISTEGHRIDWLFETTTIMIALAFVAMAVWLCWAGFFHREKLGAKARYERGDTKRDALVTFGVTLVLLVAIDGTFMVNSHSDLEVFWSFPDNDKDVMRVEVLAQQWAWNFRYPGKDGKFNTPDDIVTLNDFRVPEGRRVLCQITSKDVLHSFFLVNCRIKRDANPGEVTRLWFETRPGTAGEYQVTCAEMCGYAHYLMQAKFGVMKPEDFAKWEAEATKWSAIAYDPNAADQHWGWDWRPSGAAQ